MGLHRRPKEPRGATARRAVATGSVIGALGTGAVLVDAQSATAASSTVWDRLAACESSGNFRNADTGHNGHYGGFQFSPATWRSVGGSGLPSNATIAEQLKRAKILLAWSGPGQWECKVGLTKANGAAQGLSVLGSKGSTSGSTAKSQTSSSAAAKAVAFARAQLGKPYTYGGTGPYAWDCSGLTQAAWKAAGVSLPRVALAQFKAAHVVAPSEVRPGDLVVYLGGAHIAIYIGGEKIIEAPRPGAVVRTAPFRTGWYATHFTAVVRPGDTALDVPFRAEVKPRPKAVVPVPSTVAKTGGTYKIRTGDWLAKVARAHNVSGGWQALYALNKGAVGPDPDLVHPGLIVNLG